jgi:hypothetical protein
MGEDGSCRGGGGVEENDNDDGGDGGYRSESSYDVHSVALFHGSNSSSSLSSRQTAFLAEMSPQARTLTHKVLAGWVNAILENFELKTSNNGNKEKEAEGRKFHDDDGDSTAAAASSSSQATTTVTRLGADTLVEQLGDPKTLLKVFEALMERKYSGQAVYGWVTVGRSLIGTTEGGVESR